MNKNLSAPCRFHNASAEAQLEKVLKLAKQVDPKPIAQTAIDASQRGLATW